MSLRQIIENFSWDTLMSLPPTELLAFIAIIIAGLAGAWLTLIGVFAVIEAMNNH